MDNGRLQDYQALAAENQKLHAENEKLKVPKKPKRKINYYAGAVYCFCLVLIGTLVSTGIYAGQHLGSGLTGYYDLNADAHKHRTTPCYFTRHRRSESYDKEAEPWETYRIYKSGCDGCSNETIFENRVDGNPVEFKTKDEAWQFMKKWKLETCK
jgi:hypothetical protein